MHIEAGFLKSDSCCTNGEFSLGLCHAYYCVNRIEPQWMTLRPTTAISGEHMGGSKSSRRHTCSPKAAPAEHFPVARRNWDFDEIGATDKHRYVRWCRWHRFSEADSGKVLGVPRFGLSVHFNDTPLIGPCSAMREKKTGARADAAALPWRICTPREALRSSHGARSMASRRGLDE